MDPAELGEELLSYLPSTQSVLSSAAAATMLGMSSYRYARRQTPPPFKWSSLYNSTAPTPSKNKEEIKRLRRVVLSSRPQITNWLDNSTISIPTGTAVYEYSLTNRFTSSTGAGSYEDLVLGNKFQNIRSVFRFDITIASPRTRVIVYWARKAGNPTTIANFWNQLDPDAFNVVYDRTLYPKGVQSSTTSNVHQFALNHRGKISHYNESSGVLEQGDLRMVVICEHGNAASQTLIWSHRLFLRNK